MGYLTYEDGTYIRTVGSMYLPYITYQGMGGTLDVTTFENFEFEAETIVNWYTFNRLKGEETYPDELERCMFRLIYLIKLEADAMMLGSQSVTTTDEQGNRTTVTTDAPISSQSNDGVSISYNNINASDIVAKLTANDKNNPLRQTVFRYLQGVKNSKGKVLTYRGVYPDE